jgi:hypothetical protein
MASLEQGTFHGPQMYAADDMEAYSVGGIALLDQSVQRGGMDLGTAYFAATTSNYGSDDFELETVGSIHSLHNGGRSGDCLLKNGKFI